MSEPHFLLLKTLQESAINDLLPTGLIGRRMEDAASWRKKNI
jgi:hypothetical protein